MTFKQCNRRDFIRKSLLLSGYSLSASSLLLSHLVEAIGKVPKPLPPGQSIFTLKGKVFVDGQQANENTPIYNDAKIETNKNSQIIFVNGTNAHLVREQSTITLTQADGLTTGLHLAKGRLLSVFGKKADADKTLTLSTTTATIGIRGTGVYTESYPDYSYVCTCYGQTQINSTFDSQSTEVVTTVHHDSPRYVYKQGKVGQLITPAPMINHDDEELMLIEALVGRTPPFSSIGSYNKRRRSY